MATCHDKRTNKYETPHRNNFTITHYVFIL